jgi:hypothetical protein
LIKEETALPNWIFIAGCGHTGSTLLAKMLAQHPEIFCDYKENGQFLLYNYFGLSKLLSDQNQVASGYGKRFVLEKTPRHVWHLDEIRRCLPTARIILTVREPRATILSLFKRTGDLESSIRRYQDDTVQVIRQASHFTDIQIVKYEELTSDAISVTKQVCNYLDIDWNPGLLEFHKDSNTWFNGQIDAHTTLRNSQLSQPLYSSEKTWIDNSAKTPRSLEDWYQEFGVQIAEALGY